MAPLFPLAWTDELEEIAEYNRKYLTLGEAKIIHLMGKFEVMESRTLISLWMKGNDNLTDYLSKFWITYLFIGIFI